MCCQNDESYEKSKRDNLIIKKNILNTLRHCAKLLGNIRIEKVKRNGEISHSN